MGARVWVVIPTYNEAENVVGIVKAVTAQLDSLAAGEYHVLIVDDGSPDGTGSIADALAAENATVSVLHRREKNGLGHAYREGFALALADGAQLVCEMDADFSHDPRYLGDLLAAAERAPVVLGSRYVAGGGVRNWGLLRRIVSRGGGMYARRILGVSVQDLTGGYKCLRREVLEAIDLDSVRADGYVFQIEVTYRAILAGFEVVEVPIIFSDRTAGASKMSAQIALEAIWKVPSLRRTARAALDGSPRPTTSVG
jgi:dolichol-phosphate mannosyltransferase